MPMLLQYNDIVECFPTFKREIQNSIAKGDQADNINCKQPVVLKLQEPSVARQDEPAQEKTGLNTYASTFKSRAALKPIANFSVIYQKCYGITQPST